MATNSEEKKKKLVLEAFDTLFNKRDYKAADKYWSPNYVQHSPHIQPGRDGLFNLIRGTPASLRYEPGLLLCRRESASAVPLGILQMPDRRIGLERREISAQRRQVVPSKPGIRRGGGSGASVALGGDIYFNNADMGRRT